MTTTAPTPEGQRRPRKPWESDPDAWKGEPEPREPTMRPVVALDDDTALTILIQQTQEAAHV